MIAREVNVKIACLGWGSLIWDPQTLPMASGWHTDGPQLPIEFARQSKEGHITLVVTEAASPVRVLWCELAAKTPKEGFTALVKRERITARDPSRVIGLWTMGQDPVGPIAGSIAGWAAAKSIDAVVWTALGPKFGGEDRIPSQDEVVNCLTGLGGDVRRRAEEYVRCAPAQISTTYRTAIETAIGWTPRNA